MTMNVEQIININNTELDTQVFSSFGKVITNKDGIIQKDS